MKRLEQVHILEMVGYRDRRPQSQRNPLPIVQTPTTGDFLGIVANHGGLVEQIIRQAGYIDVPVFGVAIPEGTPLAGNLGYASNPVLQRATEQALADVELYHHFYGRQELLVGVPHEK
jgi:hypothetical protein